MEILPGDKNIEKSLINQEKQCYICLDDLDVEKQDLVLTRCGHLFHYECIYDTFKANYSINSKHDKEYECPYCRSMVNTLPKYKTYLYPKLGYNGYYYDCRCSAILKSGKRKGEICNVFVRSDGEKYCGRHKNYKKPLNTKIDKIESQFKTFKI